jgi:D-arabinose 1-dehydrogenase-like Zn-dependent alcohol dehydrogenase
LIQTTRAAGHRGSGGTRAWRRPNPSQDLTVRGSIVGTRLDLQEALAFAGAGKVRATVTTERLENINDVFSRMHAGAIDERVVLDMHG